MQMNKNTTYWICQIAGWTAYCVSETLIYSWRFGYSNGLLINAAVTILLGISITHTYRYIIKRYSWLDLSWNQLVPRIACCVLLMAVIMVKFFILLDFYTVEDISKHYSPQSIVFFIINWSKLLLLWSGIYLLYQYFERSREFANNQF
jgi:two-component system, LytTR family, sensor kinase